MTRAEMSAAIALRAAIRAIEYAQGECEQAGCDGDAIVYSMRNAIDELTVALKAIED